WWFAASAVFGIMNDIAFIMPSLKRVLNGTLPVSAMALRFERMLGQPPSICFAVLPAGSGLLGGAARGVTPPGCGVISQVTSDSASLCIVNWKVCTKRAPGPLLPGGETSTTEPLTKTCLPLALCHQ